MPFLYVRYYDDVHLGNLAGDSHFVKITGLRTAPLGAANLFAVLMLPRLRPALFWSCE